MLGDNIKKYRKEAGLSQDELGEKAGVSGVAIGRYEAGTREPKYGVVLAIAEALGVDAFDLYGLERLTDEQKHDLFDDRVRLLRIWDVMNDEGQKKVLGYAQDLLNTGNYTRRRDDR